MSSMLTTLLLTDAGKIKITKGGPGSGPQAGYANGLSDEADRESKMAHSRQSHMRAADAHRAAASAHRSAMANTKSRSEKASHKGTIAYHEQKASAHEFAASYGRGRR